MRFLIVKTSSLGDILHAFPAIDFLKNRYPECSIDWIVERPFSELLIAHPEIDRVIKVDTKKWRKTPFSRETAHAINLFRKELRLFRYKAAFDLQGNIKSGLLLSQARAKKKVGFGRKSVAEWPHLLFTNYRRDPPRGKNIREDYLYLLQAFFDDFSPVEFKGVVLLGEKKILPVVKGKKIIVCPGAFWTNKRLPEFLLLAHLKALLQKEEAFFFFVWGEEEEKKNCSRLSSHFPQNSCVLERLSLVALQGIMQQADLIIAMDSLPLHLAGTTSTPAWGFFGPSLGTKYLPLGKEKRAFQGKCPYGVTFDKRCPYLRTCEDAPCIRSLSP